MAELDDLQIEDLERAARELDALWDMLASLGDRDSRDGAEYRYRSVAPLLRKLAEEAK